MHFHFGNILLARILWWDATKKIHANGSVSSSDWFKLGNYFSKLVINYQRQIQTKIKKNYKEKQVKLNQIMSLCDVADIEELSEPEFTH